MCSPAGRNLNWVYIGLALFAANISTIHLVGLAASGFNEGMVWGNFEWLAGITLIFLALVFAPFYFKSRIQTLPEFLEDREQNLSCHIRRGLYLSFTHNSTSYHTPNAYIIFYVRQFHIP